MDLSDQQPGDPTAMYWRVERAATGHGVGMRYGDDRMSDTVSMELWCQDLATPGRFVMEPGHAEALAAALLDSARRVREVGDG